MLLLLPPLTALLGGLLTPLFSSRRARNVFVLSAVLLSSALLVIAALPGDSPEFTLLTVLPGFSLSFRVDPVNRIFLLLLAFLWPLSTLYAQEYMAEHESREARFFTFFTLSFAVSQLLALSSGLFSLYVFYECLTLITLPLVTHREDADSLRAGMTYLKYTIGGAALGFIGLVTLAHFGAAGSFAAGGALDPELIRGSETLLRAVWLISFVGFGAKAAIFPLSAWLPRASVAPTPVTALLHAVAVVNAGVFACLRLTYDCFGVSLLAGSAAASCAMLLSAFTILFGAVMAVRERHLKRRLAWSTVYNLAYMLFAVTLMSAAGLRGALTHLVFHGLIKISLFFCAGVFQIRSGAEYMRQLRGIGRKLPWTAGFFTLSAVALVGIPPFIGFLSKWAILSAAVSDAAALSAGSWPIWVSAAAVVLSSVLGCVYLLEPALQMYFLPAAVDLPVRSDPSWKLLLPLGLLAVCIVVLGVWTAPMNALLDAAAALY